MTERSDRQQRSSSTPLSTSSKSKMRAILPFILVVVAILSIMNINDSSISITQQEQRRFLQANFDETLVDGDHEENIWRRQLRVRKQKNGGRKLVHQQQQQVEGGLPEHIGRKMAAIPRYVSVVLLSIRIIVYRLMNIILTHIISPTPLLYNRLIDFILRIV